MCGVARYVGAVAALGWSIALSIVGALVSSDSRSEVGVDGRFHEVRLTFLESQGRGVWWALAVIGIAVPLAMVVFRSLRTRQVIFALAVLGVLSAVASVGVFYVPWLIGMVPSILPDGPAPVASPDRSVVVEPRD
jgi:hypothetical protein